MCDVFRRWCYFWFDDLATAEALTSYSDALFCCHLLVRLAILEFPYQCRLLSWVPSKSLVRFIYVYIYIYIHSYIYILFAYLRVLYCFNL